MNNLINTTTSEIEDFHNLENGRACVEKTSHENNLLISKPLFGMLLAARCSPLLFAILHVLLASASSKMLWIYTRTIVALVHNIVTLWNWANVMLVGKSVNAHDLTSHECAVASRTLCANPNPTLSKLRFVGRYWAVLVGFIKQPLYWGSKHIGSNETARHPKRESRKTLAAFGITGESSSIMSFYTPIQSVTQ